MKIINVMFYPGKNMNNCVEVHAKTLLWMMKGFTHGTLVMFECLDQMEFFLSTYGVEGCTMTPFICSNHDAHAANAALITHLMRHIFGAHGYSLLQLIHAGFRVVENTDADSIDVSYALWTI
ncbi:hypothetical protein ACHAW6_001548 [Cyclotella cf. meneghiniana]